MSGSDYERAFVRMMCQTQETDGVSWWAQRAAASGSATTADLPDVTFARDGAAYAGELKTTSDHKIYVGQEEYAGLHAYAVAYGMRAVILGRFKGERAFYVWNPTDMDVTEGKQLRGRNDDDSWSLKIAEPEGNADGIYPNDLTWMHLERALEGNTEVSDEH